jgi:riboflavin biosynthesis pyrimidine reductase
VLVGAGTVRAAPKHEWTPRHVHRSSGSGYAEFRASAGLASEQPTTMVVTARGDLDPAHPGLAAPDVPVVVVTTAAGAGPLGRSGFGEHVSVQVAAGSEGVPPSAPIEIAARLGARVVLCEGGPHLIADLLAARLLDELFLTVAPQIAGRDEATTRLALVEGRAFEPDDAPWSRLRSVHLTGDHLFLRYDFAAEP